MSTDHLETRILEVLDESSPQHVMDLTVKVEEHPITVDQTCTRLHDGGLLTLFSHGMYEITDHGQRRLAENGDNRRAADRNEA